MHRRALWYCDGLRCHSASQETARKVLALNATTNTNPDRSERRLLIADDSRAWRARVRDLLQSRPDWEIVAEADDGQQAVLKTVELHPDVVILDIGMPLMSGIEAAGVIRQLSPPPRIVFLTANDDSEMRDAALAKGAGGYVIKANAATELLAAVEAVLQDKQLVNASLTGFDFGDPENERTARHHPQDKVSLIPLPNVDTSRRHEVGFYSDDRRFLDDMTHFISAAFKDGNAVIVVATESHRSSLLARLQAQGLDIGGAIEQGTYAAFDATEALATFMVDDALDPVRFMESFGNLIATAAKTAPGDHRRVTFFGEGTNLLWQRGNVRAAIEDEILCNELTKTYDVDILCAYSVGDVEGGMETNLFQQVCAQHSTVYSR